jgi:hypothetical protein
MASDEHTSYTVLTANQIVAYNLRQARLLRNWTQAEAAFELTPYLGVTWSKANYSAAERSAERPDRIRNFTADEILAFSLAFRLPITWFFLPAERDQKGHVPLVAKRPGEVEEGLIPGVLVEQLFGTPRGQADVEKRLNEVLDSFPTEEFGRYMQLVTHASSLASLISLRRVAGSFGTWILSLKELTRLLEEASQETSDTIVGMLDSFLEVFQRQPSYPTRRTQPEDDDAGSR